MFGKFSSALPVVLLWFLGGGFVLNIANTEYVFPEPKTAGGNRDLGQELSDMEEILKENVIQFIENAGYEIVDELASASVSMMCDKAIFKVFRGAVELHDWAIKMLDASGKVSAGLLEGTQIAMGDYDQCLDIIEPLRLNDPADPEDPLRGQYCMLKFDLPDVVRQAAIEYQKGNRTNSYLANTKTFLRNVIKMAPRADIADMRLGVCLPSDCTAEDLEIIFEVVAKDAKKMVTILRCETKKDNELQVEQIAVLAVLGLISLLVLLGTSVDAILRTMASGPVDDMFFKKQNMNIQFLVSFSLCNNFKKLVKLEKDDGQLSCVRGIKFLSVVLAVVVSTYAMPIDLHFLKYRSAFNIYKFMDQWWFAGLANSSAGIDTLFFLVGLQITYKIWTNAAKSTDNKVSVNIFKFLIVWYARLTASQLLVIALFLLFPLIGSGPIWGDVVLPEVQHCKDTWWMNVLYINNFWPANETCLFHTWFVTAIMHMLVVTPFVLWILNRWKVFGYLIILSLIMGSCVAIGLVTTANELPPAPAIYFISFLNLRWIWDKMFIQAYDHVAPFCVGILMGYLLARNPKIELRKVTVIIGWAAAAACNISIMYGLYIYRHDEPMDPSLTAFYAAAHRLGWALGMAWIVFACAYGYGGVIGEFLSWKVFIPLERLSNFIYLLHPLVIFYHTGQVRERLYLAHLDQAVYFSAYIVFTCILAALCYVMFSIPYKFLESVAWKPRADTTMSSNHVTVNKVIAIKERITNDFNVTMRDNIPEQLACDNNIKSVGVDNNAFSS